MTDDELKTALIERLDRQEQIVRRTLNDHQSAMKNVDRAEDVLNDAVKAMIAAQADARATREAIDKLFSELSDD